MSRPLILHAEPNDPLLDAMPDAEHMPVDALLPYVHRAEWPSVVRAEFPDDVVRRFAGRRVINRGFSYNGTRLRETLGEWGCHEQWCHRLLQPLFDVAGEVAHDPGLKGVSRSRLPLNSQWFLLRRERPDIQVPTFVYAFGGTRVDLHDFKNPMQKSIWSLFDWKEETHLPVSEQHWHRFFVERPVGTPVLMHFVGDRVGFVFPRGPMSIDEAAFRELAGSVSTTFRSRIGEVLSYVEDDGTIRFHAFSPYLLSVARQPSFRDDLRAAYA
ncbi:hypothetical protein P3W24_17540 [Luteibacter sp. PPL201]|uniref:Uncharacterized protein n=1 Tax=Luteibacter sahnii TaxID=3021977 RepID=A0ABT6BF72_9GAMM|nr:hypothetical protein [Luteibacter sp. PPL193]MDY1549148.1 hypothetical protein [Luteibacter sp. PPL193]